MDYGNFAVIVMVIAVVTCVLGIGYGALYLLDKAVDPGAR